MSTILITGGTGLVGRALTRLLLQQGYDAVILTRNAGNKPPVPGVRYAEWNIQDGTIDPAVISQADHIIHLAGAGVVEKKWTPGYKKEIMESRTKSSRLLVDALKYTPNHVLSVISMSAIGWYGQDHVPVKIFEETDPSAPGFLGDTCRRWEESIAPVADLGKRLVKLRTGIVLSTEGGAMAEFRKPLHFAVAAVLGNGNQIISWIHIDDLCRMILYAIENERLQGVYNAVAPGPVSNKTLTLSLARAVNKRFFIPLKIPSFVLRTILGQRSSEILKSATVSCKKIQDAGFEFRFSNIEDAMKDLARIKGRP